MNKILQSKITKKILHPQHHQTDISYDIFYDSEIISYSKIIDDVAKDLMQPREAAVSKLLLMCKTV